jgi:hypothetical protein
MSSLPNEIPGSQNKVDAWTSFVIDPRTSKVYSVANGGHSDYGGNEVDMLDLNRNDPQWFELLARTPAASYIACSEYYADGRPTSRHTYYGVTFNEFDNRIMLLGGSWSCGNGTPFLQTIDSYNINSNSYSPAGTHPRLPSPFGDTFAVSYTYDPFTGDIYAVQTGQTGRWNRSSNTFTANLNPGGDFYNGGYTETAFDTKRGRIYTVGGESGGDHHYYTLATNTWTSFTLTGPNAGNVDVTVQGAMIYDEAIDRFFIRLGGAGATVYQLHPTTFEVTIFPTTGGTSIPATANGPYKKFLYAPNLGGVVYVPTYGGNAWFLRLH